MASKINLATAMSDLIKSAKLLDFPPCYSIEHLEIAENFVFGLLPGLTKFIRKTTVFERAVGITYTHALFQKATEKSHASTDARFRSIRKTPRHANNSFKR